MRTNWSIHRVGRESVWKRVVYELRKKGEQPTADTSISCCPRSGSPCTARQQGRLSCGGLSLGPNNGQGPICRLPPIRKPMRTPAPSNGLDPQAFRSQRIASMRHCCWPARANSGVHSCQAEDAEALQATQVQQQGTTSPAPAPSPHAQRRCAPRWPSPLHPQ